MIGRDDDVRVIVYRIRCGEVRLLTLTGPGGVGKTRLAVEVARAMELDYRGRRVLRLARAAQPPRGVAQAIGRPGDRRALGPVVRAGGHALPGRQALLLVVDNLEHVLGAALFIGGLVGACPDAHGHRDQPRAARRSRPSVRYPPRDARRGGRAMPSRCSSSALVPTIPSSCSTTRRRDVAEICRRLDGLPLALELAAARARCSDGRDRSRLDAGSAC